MAGFGSRGTIVGVMGAGGDGNAQETVVSYDAYGTNGSDAITVAYMEPSLVMNSTYAAIPKRTTSTMVFNPSHLDYFNKLMQFVLVISSCATTMPRSRTSTTPTCGLYLRMQAPRLLSVL